MAPEPPKAPGLSVIVPLYNEEESAPLLYQAVTDTLAKADIDYEILFIDDGSKDNTVQVCERLCKTDPRLRLIKFRRNCGQTPAMAAGIDIARGEVLVTMDGDLRMIPPISP